MVSKAQPKYVGGPGEGRGEGKWEGKLLIPAVLLYSRRLINQIVNNVMVNVSSVFLKASKHFIAFDPSSNRAICLCQVVSACRLTWTSKSVPRPTRGKGAASPKSSPSSPHVRSSSHPAQSEPYPGVCCVSYFHVRHQQAVPTGRPKSIGQKCGHLSQPARLGSRPGFTTKL